jgi:hypothetical protein
LPYAFGSANGDADDLDNTNKSFQEGAFATLYTLTKSRQLDASLRLSILKVVLEFLQASAGSRCIQCTATATLSTFLNHMMEECDAMYAFGTALGNFCCCPASMQQLQLTLLAAVLLPSAALPCSVQHLLPLGHSYRPLVGGSLLGRNLPLMHVACHISNCTVALVVYNVIPPHLAMHACH